MGKIREIIAVLLIIWGNKKEAFLAHLLETKYF